MSPRPVLSLFLLAALAVGCSKGFYSHEFDGGPDGGADGGARSDGGKKSDRSSDDDDDDELPTSSIDAGKKETGAPPPPPPMGGCAPDDMSGFSPSWTAPAPFHVGACTAPQVELLVDCSFEGFSPDCDAAVTASENQACIECLFTATTASQYGPLVVSGSIATLNIAGCIARTTGNTASTGCGAKFQAAQQCAIEACEMNCDDYELGVCVDEASTTVCASFESAAECAEPLLDTGGASETCAQGVTFVDRAIALGKLFCTP